MPIFLGLVGSLVSGISDFCARYVARRNHAATTAATGLIFATSAAVLVASFGPGGFLATDYLFGCVSGLASGSALALLYRGLAVSSVAVVSPIVAVMLGAIPMFWEVATGTSLTTGVMSGVFIALFGLMVTTFDPALGDRVKQGVILGLASGLCFGIGLVFMAQTSVEGGLWPVVGQRSTACIILIGFAPSEACPELFAVICCASQPQPGFSARSECCVTPQAFNVARSPPSRSQHHCSLFLQQCSQRLLTMIPCDGGR